MSHWHAEHALDIRMANVCAAVRTAQDHGHFVAPVTLSE
jgi:hypothetical protein